MSVDFVGEINLRPVTDDWGPFQADFSGGLPSGETISAVSIRAYVGRIFPGQNRTGLTDIALDVIESGSISIGELTVNWTMQLPVDSPYRNSFITMVFEITTSNNRQYPFYFHGVSTF